VSLRSRLVAGFIAVALALLGADVVVTLLVRHSLISATDRRLSIDRAFPRVDNALPANVRSASKSLTAPPTTPATTSAPAEPPAPPLFPRGITDLYVAYVAPDGTVQNRLENNVGHAANPPKLPQDIARHAPPAGQKPHVFSLGAEGGDYGYRAIAIHTSRGGTLVIAVSTKDEVDTLNKVLLVEAIASLLVLLALATVAWWILHLGVRPLDQMARTAEAIAEGDLSRRVDRAEPRTEVGRLGLAFNTMVSEIEEAFDERTQSEERLRRFIADASHELRTPLTSIRGYAELWRQGGLDNDVALADAMRRIEAEGARMGVLVDDLLLLARLDQGRPLDTEPVDLAVLARDAVADARAVEPDRAVTIEAPAHLIVTGDEGRLRQVVSNLLANVRVHTPPGTAARVRLAEERSSAVLEVEDDGPGFGPDPGRAFERFYRADPARARASGGIGLGLSIVSSVVGAHGGQASAGAGRSGGARVRVELPLATAGRTDGFA